MMNHDFSGLFHQWTLKNRSQDPALVVSCGMLAGAKNDNSQIEYRRRVELLMMNFAVVSF